MGISDSNNTDDFDNAIHVLTDGGGSGLKATVFTRGDGKNAIATDTVVTGVASVAPCLSTKYRSNVDTSGAVLTGSFITIFTKSGTGKFYGFVVDFITINVQLKLTIDSNVIFDIDAGELNGLLVGFPQDLGTASQTTAGGPSWDNTSKKYAFYSPYPIPYVTDVKIEALRPGGGNNSWNSSIVNLEEVT